MATAWNSTRNVAAHTASGVPTPAQATMRPRLAIVEYASTRLALVCEMAMNAAQQEGQSAHEDGHDSRHGAHQEDRRELDEQEDAGLDHGGRMEKRGGGSRCHHSAEQPGVERHLSRLGDAGERQRHRRQGDKRRSHDTDGDELHERERVHSQRDGEQRHQKADAASQVHDDLAKRVVDGLRRFWCNR